MGRRLSIALLALVCTSHTWAGGRLGAPETVSGGEHWRLATANGPVHVWRPKGTAREHGGIIVYVHGYYTDVDEAFTRHQLAQQFAASGRDATFIVPEAPESSDQETSWPALGDLLRAVAGAGVPLPRGPLVVVGHSAAYRTIVGWLDYEPLREIVLLDALYGNEEDFLDWLDGARGHAGHRLTLVTADTDEFADGLLRRVPDARTLAAPPARWSDVPAAAREARLLEVRTEIKHMDVVAGGQVLPAVLARTRVPAVRPK